MNREAHDTTVLVKAAVLTRKPYTHAATKREEGVVARTKAEVEAERRLNSRSSKKSKGQPAKSNGGPNGQFRRESSRRGSNGDSERLSKGYSSRNGNSGSVDS